MFNPDVYANPEKYVIKLPAEKVVSDSKVQSDVVCRYGRRIAQGQDIEPIIVIKHPKRDLYAVVDGHHRYHAYRQLGQREIPCALEGVFPSVIFYMTKKGFFQPKPKKDGHTRISFRVMRYFMKLFFNQAVDTLPFTEVEKRTSCP